MAEEADEGEDRGVFFVQKYLIRGFLNGFPARVTHTSHRATRPTAPRTKTPSSFIRSPISSCASQPSKPGAALEVGQPILDGPELLFHHIPGIRTERGGDNPPDQHRDRRVPRHHKYTFSRFVIPTRSISGNRVHGALGTASSDSFGSARSVLVVARRMITIQVALLAGTSPLFGPDVQLIKHMASFTVCLSGINGWGPCAAQYIFLVRHGLKMGRSDA
jgi:hypothetical protein